MNTSIRWKRGLLGLAFAVWTSLSAGSAAADTCSPPAGIQAWWPAENSGNDTAGSNPATPQNGAGYGPGKAGAAFVLDGFDDFYRVPDAPSLRPQSLTAEGWFNFSSTSGVRMLFGKSLGTGPLESFGAFLNGGQLSGLICEAAGFGPILSTPFAPSPGIWYHVAYTFNDAANIQSLYINGVLSASGAVTQSIAYDANPFTIGAEYESGAPAYQFAGAIDELALYNRPLMASELQAIFSAGASGKCVFAAPAPDSFVVGSDGGSFAAPSFGRCEFPAGTLPAPRQVKVAAVSSTEFGEPYDLAASIFQLGERLPFETRISIASSAPQQPITLHVALPAAFLAQLPIDKVPVILAAMSEESEFDSVYVVDPVLTQIVGDTATIVCMPERFVRRDSGGSVFYDLLLVVSSMPEPAAASQAPPGAASALATVSCPAEPICQPVGAPPSAGGAFGATTMRTDGSTYTHLGQDYAVQKGTAMLAADAGTVERVVNRGAVGFGYYLTIRHSHGVTLYAHLALAYVTVGQHVSKAQVIALSGASGGSKSAHAHFEYLPRITATPYSPPGRADPLPCAPNPPSWGTFVATCGAVSDVATDGQTAVAHSDVIEVYSAEGDLISTTNGEAVAAPGGLMLGLRSFLQTINPTLHLVGPSSRILTGSAQATYDDFVFYRDGAAPGEVVPIHVNLTTNGSVATTADIISAGQCGALATANVSATINGQDLDFGTTTATRGCGGPPPTCSGGVTFMPGVFEQNGQVVSSGTINVPVNVPVTVSVRVNGRADTHWDIAGTIGGAPTSLNATALVGQTLYNPTLVQDSKLNHVNSPDGLRPIYTFFPDGDVFGVPAGITVSSSKAGVFNNHRTIARTLDVMPPTPEAVSAGQRLQLLGPNPCRDNVGFRIAASAGGRLQLVDVQGRALLTRVIERSVSGSAFVSVPTGPLQAGVYFARWSPRSGEEQATVRFVKIH